MRLTAQTVMGNGPTAVSEFKNVIGRRVELETVMGHWPIESSNLSLSAK